MRRYEYLIGLNDKNGKALDRFPYRLGELKRTLAETFDGGTIVNATGIWEGRSEPSLAVIVVTAKPLPVAILYGRALATIFDQSEVILNESSVQTTHCYPSDEADLLMPTAELDKIRAET